MRVAGIACAVGFLGSVLAANYATTRFGFVPVGLGESATAGTLIAGLALALRDGVQDALGRRTVLAVAAVGAVLSYVIASAARRDGSWVRMRALWRVTRSSAASTSTWVV